MKDILIQLLEGQSARLWETESHQDLSIPGPGCDRTSLRVLTSAQRLPLKDSPGNLKADLKAGLEVNSWGPIRRLKAAKPSGVAFTRDPKFVHPFTTKG